MRERKKHDSAFGLRGAWQRNESLGRLVSRIRLGRRMLRRRLRLPLIFALRSPLDITPTAPRFVRLNPA
jgi:hypothetical protein